MHWSCGYHAQITWLIMHRSRKWSCTVHVTDHVLITWLIMHRSRGWSCTDHVTDHALITWLSCTDHVADHAQITCLTMHWSRGWSYTAHVTDHALIMWLSCTDHVTDHAQITCLTMHWSRGYHACSRNWSWKKIWELLPLVVNVGMIMDSKIKPKLRTLTLYMNIPLLKLNIIKQAFKNCCELS